ncbi:hypothetical protein [Streptomyces sp. CB00455]|nr:hypothetical protein [Streptomyces sp. CB00455]
MRRHLRPDAPADRITPGGEAPQTHLERRLTGLPDGAERLTADLR